MLYQEKEVEDYTKSSDKNPLMGINSFKGGFYKFLIKLLILKVSFFLLKFDNPLEFKIK